MKTKSTSKKNNVGRPPRDFPRKVLSMKIEPETLDSFRDLCSKLNMSQSQAFTFISNSYRFNPDHINIR